VLAQSKVTSLNLEGNNIGDKGAIALAEALPQSKVTSITLGYNKISDAGVAALVQIAAKPSYKP